MKMISPKKILSWMPRISGIWLEIFKRQNSVLRMVLKKEIKMERISKRRLRKA